MHFSPWVDMAVVGETYQARPSRHSENNTQNKEDIMKLTIIAATGGVGRQVLRQARHAGHDVARNSAKLPAEVLAAGAARVVTADLASSGAQALEPAVAGAGDSTRCSTFR